MITNKNHSSIVFVNQSSGYLMIDIVNAFEQKFSERILVTGLLNQRNNSLNANVKLHKIITYDRSSAFKRLYTWAFAFLQAMILIKLKYNKSHLFLVSNPPFSFLIPLFCKNSYSLLVYDVYPNALVETNILSNANLVVKLWKKLNHRVFESAEHVYTLTDSMSAVLEKYMEKKRPIVVPIWSDNTFLKPIPHLENPFIIQHGLKGKFIVLYSGNIGSTSDVEVIIDIASMIEDPAIIFLVIGEGTKKNHIIRKANSLGVNNCIFLNWQETTILPYSLASADIAVVSLGLSASKIGIPSKLFNYISVGSPILGLASKDSDLEKIINKFEIGKCFEPQQKEEIRNFINLLSNNSNYCKELSKKSLIASESFTPDNAFKFLI